MVCAFIKVAFTIYLLLFSDLCSRSQMLGLPYCIPNFFKSSVHRKGCCLPTTRFTSEEDANHGEKGDHSGAKFDLCTVYGHIHQQHRTLGKKS